MRQSAIESRALSVVVETVSFEVPRSFWTGAQQGCPVQETRRHKVIPTSKYTPDFREEAVQIALRSSKTISETA
ncbi:putative transposase [Streptomyces sp. NBRC 110611]|nr:putative transposase [Streptomyces sp. NBRC 110611]